MTRLPLLLPVVFNQPLPIGPFSRYKRSKLSMKLQVVPVVWLRTVGFRAKKHDAPIKTRA